MSSFIFIAIIGTLFAFGSFKLIRLAFSRANEFGNIQEFNRQLNEQKERLPSNDAKVCIESMKIIMNSEVTTFVLRKFGNNRSNRSGQDMVLEIDLFMRQCIAKIPREAVFEVLTYINENNNFKFISRLDPNLIQDLECLLKKY